MENALLVGLSRQIALRRELDVIANNVANMTTTGFKREAVVFKEEKQSPARVNTFPAPDRPVSFVIDWATAHDTTEGSIDYTSNPTDVAIKGDEKTFFVVQSPNGERYSRNGAFQLSANGTLVNNEGYAVMGEGGPITFGPQEGAISIARDGTISTKEGIRGRIRLARFDNPQQLQKEGLSLFTTTTAAQPANLNNVSLVQGALERSNVKPITEVTRMIEVTRAYESTSQIIQRTEDLRRSSIERLGRLQSS